MSIAEIVLRSMQKSAVLICIALQVGRQNNVSDAKPFAERFQTMVLAVTQAGAVDLDVSFAFLRVPARHVRPQSEPACWICLIKPWKGITCDAQCYFSDEVAKKKTRQNE